MPEAEHEVIRERIVAWRDSFQPVTSFEQFLHEMVCTESIRLERCRDLQIVLRDEQVVRAETTWDLDRRVEIEQLALRLPRRPALISRALEQSAQGVAWKLERWEFLADVLQTRDWTEVETSRAWDLLGVPPEERAPEEPPDRAERRELAALERQRLVQLKAEILDDRDADHRDLARHDRPCQEPPALRNVRRYEAAALRRFQWAVGLLRPQRRAGTPRTRLPVPAPAPANPVPSTDSTPAPQPTPTPTPKAELSPVPEPSRRPNPGTTTSPIPRCKPSVDKRLAPPDHAIDVFAAITPEELQASVRQARNEPNATLQRSQRSRRPRRKNGR